MPSIALSVSRYLDEDLILREVLDRGILNLRRAARWLIEREGWDATEEAVVSALRRHAGTSDGARLEEARGLVARAGPGVRSRLARLSVARWGPTGSVLRGLGDVVGPEDLVGVLPGETRFQVLVDDERCEGVLGALGRERVQAVRRDVALVRVAFPGVNGTSGAVHGAAAIVLSAMVQGGVDVLDVFSCGGEWVFVVPGAEAVRAYDVVSRTVGLVP